MKAQSPEKRAALLPFAALFRGIASKRSTSAMLRTFGSARCFFGPCKPDVGSSVDEIFGQQEPVVLLDADSLRARDVGACPSLAKRPR